MSRIITSGHLFGAVVSRLLILAAAYGMLFSATVYAQGTGTIVGKITDEKTKEGLPSVNVKVKGTYYGAASDIDGNFRIEKMNPGVYNIDVTLLGYKTVQYSGVKLEAGKTVTLTVKMGESVLALGTEVVIIGEKRLFDVEETSSKKAIKNEDMTVAALRDVKDVVGLQTGVVQSDNEIHIRGSRGYENAYLVDGVSVQDVLGGTGFGLQVSTDAIQEVEVITGGYNAEYGQATSGVINITTKEGAARYGGSISYKTDKFLGAHSRANWNTDIIEGTVSGPVPIIEYLVPGSLSFFGNFSANVTDGFTGWSETIRDGKPVGWEKHAPNQLVSSIFGGSKYAFRQSNAYSGATKLTWKPSATFKLSYSYNQSVSIDQNSSSIKTTLEREEPTPGYQYEYKNILDSAGTYTQINVQQTIAITHTLSPKSYYDLRVSRYTAHVRGDANGKDYNGYSEPKDIVTFPIQYYNRGSDTVGVIPGDGFYDVGSPTSWRDHYLDEFTVKLDYTFHFTEENKFKMGFESKFQTLQMIDISQPWIKPRGLNNDIYGGSGRDSSLNPAMGAFYAQDNIVLKGMVLNFGLRFDYWFPGKFVDDAIDNPNIMLASEDIRDKYKDQTWTMFGRHWKGRLSPRLGISHPVSDNQTLFFSYGHFSKLPKPTYVYSKLTESSARSNSQTIGNPNLNPETTVAYELGLRNQLTENDVLTVTAYYKDIFDYITARTVAARGGRYFGTYTTYVNSDYARTRGVEFEYSKRMGSHLNATLSGSYSIATGKSSSATEALYNLVSGGIETSIKESFVSWDRPLQASLSMNVRVKKDEPLFDFAPGVLDDYNLYARAFYQSGKRYTAQLYYGVGTDGRSEYRADPYNVYEGIGDYWFYINLNFEKYFDLGFSKLTVSMEVQNVLDNKNSQVVNPVTGRAYEYGDETPASYNDPRFPKLQGTVTPYPYNPARYLAPRTAKIGVSFKF